LAVLLHSQVYVCGITVHVYKLNIHLRTLLTMVYLNISAFLNMWYMIVFQTIGI